MTLPQDFASHWTLDPKVHFLNHGSFGAVPAEVQEYQRDLRDRMEREPVDFILRQRPDLFRAAREAVAEFVNADSDGLVFVSNTTDGVNAVLRSMAIEPGDEFVYTNHGYNACNNVVDYVTQRAGARAVVAQIPFPIQDPEEVWAGIEAALTERTKLVLIDHVTSPTGLVFPVESIVRKLHERGVLVLIDGAHAPGMLPVDIAAIGADFYVANGHKWTCAPKTVAFLYVQEAHRPSVWPTTISHGANTSMPGSNRFHDQFDWPGTIDFTPALSWPVALKCLESMVPGGWSAIYERNRSLALQGRSLMCKALGIAEPSPASMIGALAAVPLPDVPPEERGTAFEPDALHVHLWREHAVEVPVFHFPGEPGRMIRISAHLHNRSESYSVLAEILEAHRG